MKFILLFTLAIQYKFFPLFVYVPLLLLETKKVLRIAGAMLPPAATVILFQLPFLNDGAGWEEKSALNVDMLDRMFGNKLPLFETEIPLSLLFMGAVCIYCYLKDVDEKQRDYHCMFIPFLAMSALFLSFPFFPYWIIYLTPWMVMLYFMRDDMRERYFWVESGMTGAILFAQFSHFYWVFETFNAEQSFLNYLLPYKKLPEDFLLFNFASISRLSKFEGCVYGLYVLCLIFMVVLYLPKKEMRYKDDSFNCRKVMWQRFGIQFFAGAFPLWLYIAYSIAAVIL